MGSSPRVWGQDVCVHQVNGGYRIIPTRVGTRIYPNENVMTCEDHPHACGDKAETHLYRSKDRGSSPRVWGQVNMDKVEFLGHRIIPTRVGTSLHDNRKSLHFQDHPHACGDKPNDFVNPIAPPGSSPRVWGQD